jgi:hypothetical protein
MAADQLSKANPDGTALGQSATDKITMYGGTPVVQRSSTVLATSLLSASSYVSVASNTAAILTEISNALTNLNAIRTTA